MANRLYLDFETRSILDIRDVGAYKYASHPSTEPICFAYAFDDGPVQLWKRGGIFPMETADHIFSGGLVVAHNAGFDTAIWNKPSWANRIMPRQVICTAAKCRAAGIPAELADAAIFLNLPYQKMTTGKLLVKRLCRPKGVSPLVWDENPVALEQMYEYCMRDVETMRALDKALPDLTPEEHKVWCLDQEINSRGVKVDQEFCEKGQKLVEEYKAGLDADMREITSGAVQSTTEVAKITNWAVANGATTLKAIGKKDIADALDGELPPIVRSALTIRRNFAKTSAAKLGTFLDCMEEGGRVRDQYVYHGAGTGRWSGKLGQLQNLPRFPKGIEISHAVDAVKTGSASEIMKIGLTPSEAVSSCLRAAVVASEGRMLYGADYNAIEARVLAWLSCQNDVVSRFATGEDVYLYTASRIYGRPISEADEQERTIGKVAVLALGYQGGVNAFENMARNYGVNVDPEKRGEIVRSWREANPRIVQYWREVEQAALDAVENPGSVFSAGPIDRSIKFSKRGDFLLMKLPSGRKVSYPKPGVVINTKFGRRMRQVVYTGKLTGKTGTFQLEMYGGKFVENLTQAVARDCLVAGMFNLEAGGFRVVAHTHDEVICEGEGMELKKLEDLMTLPISWAKGLPLAVKGWQGVRYAK